MLPRRNPEFGEILNMNMSRKRYFSINLRAFRRIKGLGGINFTDLMKYYIIALEGSALQKLSSSLLKDKLVKPSAPVFIAGHWRSGTTLMHEIMSKSKEFIFPNTMECMNPTHFPLTSWILKEKEGKEGEGKHKEKRRVKRPMDDAVLSPHSPNEDEFALLCLGVVSPYLWVLCPSRGDILRHSLSTEKWSYAEREEWKRNEVWFLSAVNSREPEKMIVVKNPVHSVRIKWLSDVFPQSKFIVMVRNPEDVFFSTVKMWISLFQIYSVERKKFVELRYVFSMVFTAGKKLMETMLNHLSQIDEKMYVVVRYENLISNPEEEIEKIAERFSVDLNDIKKYLSAIVHKKRSTQVSKYDELMEFIHRVNSGSKNEIRIIFSDLMSEDEIRRQIRRSWECMWELWSGNVSPTKI